MAATYGSLLVVVLAAALVGQAVLTACGARRTSWLAPAVGLAALCAVAWAGASAGRGAGAAIAMLAVSGIALLALLGPLRPSPPVVSRGLAGGAAVLVLAVIAASLPFLAEGQVGILGTGLNPDMSQHLLAADRLAGGGEDRLLLEGYPLGPHSIALALSELTGGGLVAGFGGMTLAVSAIACLTALAALGRLGLPRRVLGALLVGLSYMVASFLAQGAFKETMQALFVLAFAVGLQQLVREGGARQEALRPPGALETHAPRALAAVPLAVLGAGSVYVYSFPGLLWLLGALAVWSLAVLGSRALRSGAGTARSALRGVAPTAAAAGAALALLVAAEVPRMLRFRDFETFDPGGAGLGNLFDRLSPLEALGVWPSGDFRVEPGAGVVPAVVFWIGAAIAAAALVHGLVWWVRRRRLAVPAALCAAALIWLGTLVAGTPYQEAKAIVLAAPLAMLVAVRPIVERLPGPGELAREVRTPVAAGGLLAVAFLAGAGGSSLLALANGPVGPATYSPGLAELRARLQGPGSTLVLAPRQLLDERHGADFIGWELRGERVCIEAAGSAGPGPPPPGVRHVIAVEGTRMPPYARLRRRAGRGPYVLWERMGASPRPAEPPCPRIAESQRADPGAS